MFGINPIRILPPPLGECPPPQLLWLDMLKNSLNQLPFIYQKIVNIQARARVVT